MGETGGMGAKTTVCNDFLFLQVCNTTFQVKADRTKNPPPHPKKCVRASRYDVANNTEKQEAERQQHFFFDPASWA